MNEARIQEKLKEKNLEALKDTSSTGRENPWKEKKMANLLLSDAYKRLAVKEGDPYYNKAIRLELCSRWLKFRKTDAGMKLQALDCCRVRLCPICTWRRSLKTYAHMERIMRMMSACNKYAYIAVNLTVKNCRDDDLKTTIDDMMKAWKRFASYTSIKTATKGFYRGFEVTHDVNRVITSEMYNESKSRKAYYDSLGLAIGDANPNYDMFHPHFHCVFAVNKSYFESRYYLPKEVWIAEWRKAMRLDYDPNVYVSRVKGDTARAVAELAKYTVKDGDFLIPNDWDLTTKTVRILDEVLADRRFIAYGGIMAYWHKELNLDDDEDGNLVNIDGDDSESDENDPIITYVWYSGYRQYIRKLD